VFWLVKTGGRRRLPVQHPEPGRHLKAVAESAMREVIGRSDIQADLTGARQTIETGVHDLMQRRSTAIRRAPGHAGARAEGRSARASDRQLRDVAGGTRRSRARADESETYAQSASCRSADVRRRSSSGGSLSRQTVAEAKGQAARYSQVFEE